MSNPRHYDLGEVHGVGLGITDAVALPGGAVLVSAAAEDSPNPRDDGPVVASALVRIDGDVVADVTPLPLVDGRVCKVEGLMLLDTDQAHTRLLAVVDVDDPGSPSLAVRLRVSCVNVQTSSSVGTAAVTWWSGSSTKQNASPACSGSASEKRCRAPVVDVGVQPRGGGQGQRLVGAQPGDGVRRPGDADLEAGSRAGDRHQTGAGHGAAADPRA